MNHQLLYQFYFYFEILYVGYSTSKQSLKNMTIPKYRIVTVTIVTICDCVLWHIVAILWLAKSGHNEDGCRKLQKSFFIWLFCDYLWLFLFLYFTSVLNRLNYIGCCRTNNYQKNFCFWWRNITSLINFGSSSMLLMPNNGSF
jgi:hypothetical protein